MRFRDRIFESAPGEITWQNKRVKAFFYRACPTLMRKAVRAENTRRPEMWNRVASDGLTVPWAWLPDVFLALRAMERKARGMRHPPFVTQVKEKLGTLRIYLRFRGAMPDDATRDVFEKVLESAMERLRSMKLTLERECRGEKA